METSRIKASILNKNYGCLWLKEKATLSYSQGIRKQFDSMTAIPTYYVVFLSGFVHCTLLLFPDKGSGQDFNVYIGTIFRKIKNNIINTVELHYPCSLVSGGTIAQNYE